MIHYKIKIIKSKEAMAYMKIRIDNNVKQVIKKTDRSKVNKCIPLRKKSKYSNGLEKAIKTNPEVKKAFKHKHTTFAKMRACSDQSVLKKEFNKAGKNVKKLIKSIRREYENSIIEKCKKQPKLLFSYINSQKNCRDEHHTNAPWTHTRAAQIS